MRENDRPKMSGALFGKKGSRRDFLRNTAVTALAGSPLAACSIDDSLDPGMFGMVTGLIVN
jgi:hypothetical protein